MKNSGMIIVGMLVAGLTGCQTTPPQVVWKLPANLGKTKSEIGIKMFAPMKTDGGQLDPGLSQQFMEAVQTKMIQAKRFHVYLPNAFCEMPKTSDADVVVKPFVDIIEQPVRIQDTGREGVCTICKVSLDVKLMGTGDGEAKEAINLDGVSKVTVPGVFGKPARAVDKKGLVVKAYEEAYKLLERQLNLNFPPAASVVSVRPIPDQLPADWKQGDPIPEPIVKIGTKGGANIGFKSNTQYMLFTMVEGTAVIVAILDADSIMDEKATFKSVRVNNTDPEALDMWSRIKAKEQGLKFFVTPYYNVDAATK